MSAGNEFEARRRAFLQRTEEVTFPDITYTVRVGSSSEDFMVDRVVNVTMVANWGSMTMVVPNGLYSGQRLLVNYVARDEVGLQTVDVTPDTTPETVTHPATYQLTTPGDYCTLEWIDGDTGWINWNNQIT